MKTNTRRATRGPGHRSRILGTATLVAAVVWLSSCTFINEYQDPPIVGDWKGKPQSKDVNQRMSIDLEGDGDGIFFFRVVNDDTVYEGRYDVEWEYRSEDEYDIDWECNPSASSPCSGLDFTLRCDINSDGDELDCTERSGTWESSEFEWVDD